MPRGRKPGSSKKVTPDSGKGAKTRKGAVGKKDPYEDEVVELEDSDNEDSKVEKVDNKEDVEEDVLPKAPTSTQAVKKVMVVPKEIKASLGWEYFQEVQLKHPRTGLSSAFLLNFNNDAKNADPLGMYEVLTMQQETRSWFFNNSVISDGNIYTCTPVDPLFLILPILAKSEKAKPLSDHLHESLLPNHVAELLSKRLSSEQLENIATKKGTDDIVAFVYSEEKAVSWLKAKAEKVAKYLSSKNISHVENSVSSNFVKVDAVGHEDCLRYACDIVGEYIDESLKNSLLEKLNLPVVQEKVGGKRKSVLEPEDDNDNVSKKAKVSDDIVPLEDYGSSTPFTPVNKGVKVTAREKELQKAAQGSHSLFKFFTPKAK